MLSVNRVTTFRALLGLFLLCNTPHFLHAASYSASSGTYAWINPATHTNVVWTAAPGGPANQCSGGSTANNDDITATLALGFNFSFGGVNYNSVRIMTNGRLQFNNTFCAPGTAANGPPRTYRYPMPDTRLVRTLRVYGADLNPGAGGTVRYASLGTAPNRYFVATWSNVPEFNSAASSFNLQAILYENGQFMFQYGSILNPSLGHAQIGWEVSTDNYELYIYNNITALQNTAIRFSADTPTALSYHPMDESSWSGAAAEIIDSSGNGYHGQALGGAVPINPGYVCNGGNMPAANAGMSIPVSLRNNVGSRGTITFWYRNTTSWNSGGDTLIADASANLGNDAADKYFFLSKLGNGRLRFRLEDTADTALQAETPNITYAANTWHHVAITYDISEDADYLQIYIDGTRRATSRADLTNPLNVISTLGSLNTLFLGLTRESGVGGGVYTTTGARGTFDEVRIYNKVLSTTQVSADRLLTHSCLHAQWNMDEAAWNGTANEVVDSSGKNYHGTATNGATTATTTPAIAGSPGTCAYGSFDGNNDYVALNTFPNLTDSFTITGWIRANRITGSQRIFADDQSNSGGYALSLGDGGAGRLRFLSRSVSPVNLDSGVVIAAGTWYHVAAVHDAVNKRRQIYVNGAQVRTQTYTGNWGSDNGTASIGGETSAAGAEATATYRFNGLLDEVRVYSRALTTAEILAVRNQSHACAINLHHFQIEHDGTALTCNPETITVRACADSSCSSVYGGSANVTLTPSGWVGGDTQTISGGTGTLQLRQGATQTVTLGISSSAPAASSAVTCLNTATAATTCALSYYDTGFIYTLPAQTACTTSSAITVNAVRLDNTSQLCVPSFQNRSATVNFWTSYANPNTGTRSLTLNNGTTNYSLATASPGTGVPLSFNGSGQANITLNYNDAGQLTLNSRFTGSGTESGLIMNGASSYVTAPYKFYVYSDDANSDCAGAVATCSAFKRAGENFNLKLRAACADNSVTPNFQLPGVTVSHINVAPAISQGVLGTSSVNFVAADNGEHLITAQTVSEVGSFTFTAAAPVTGYFGLAIGTPALNTSVDIGRFFPDHFCLLNNTLTNRTDSNTAASCTDGFNYLDEDLDLRFSLKAQAMGQVCTAADVTQNYHSTWSKMNTPFTENTTLPNETGKWNLAAVNDPAGTPTNLNARIEINTAASTPASGQFTNGQVDVLARLNINRLGSAPNYTAETPFTLVALGINPTDTDNVRIDTTNLTIGSDTYRQTASTALYFGRLSNDNAYGPETTALPMWAQSQYCSAIAAGECSAWLPKTDDSCTLYSVTAPAGTALGNATAGDGQGYYYRAAPSVSSGTYNYTAASGRVHVPDSLRHSAGWQLFYTAAGNGGDYVIPFAVHPYLRINSGTASFGQFRGDDRIIYWREIFQ